MFEKLFALSIKVVIRDDAGRCLLLKCSMSSKGTPGKWDFPSGKIDAGESFDGALLREVAEETDLAISIQRADGTAESELSTVKIQQLTLMSTDSLG